MRPLPGPSMVDGWSTRSRSTSSYGLLECESLAALVYLTTRLRHPLGRRQGRCAAQLIDHVGRTSYGPWPAPPGGQGRPGVVGAARQSAHRGRLGRSPPALATNTEMVLVELGSRRAGRARARLPLPLAEASKLGDELYEAIRKLHWSYLRAATSHPSFALSAIAQRETGSRAAGWPACRRRQGKSSGPTRSGRPRQEAAVLYDPVISTGRIARRHRRVDSGHPEAALSPESVSAVGRSSS